MVSAKVDVEKSAKTETPVQNKVDEYFQQNEKFFNTGDINAKKAFFMLGQYCKVGYGE